jgi:predicted kinase
MTQNIALESLDVVLRALDATDGESVSQAARRVIEAGHEPFADSELERQVQRTMVALTLQIATPDDAPLWLHVFEAAELAKGLGLS